ncbi:MAG: ComEC/Rec2 family competence protein, partial [Nitrospinota bacterium]|nr:ComEC/Rec2 family competence protein [Nitrospinota bacterium]
MIAPLFHAAIGLATGILVMSPRTPLSLTVAWCALAGASLLSLFSDPKHRRAARTGAAAFAAGLCLHPLQTQWETKLELLPENLRSRRGTLYGRVDRPIERGRRSERIFLRMEKIETPGGAIPIRSRARLTFYSRGLAVRYGDRVRVDNVRLHHPKGFGNPGSFDYEAYLAVRGIAAVGGVSRISRLTVLERGGGSRVLSALYGARERLLKTVRSALPPPGSHVLGALLYGERRAV